ncbi:MAG: hypothetical protein COU10_00885 [Candidatus Harrisonbacteria bacterium CG10_big_fil_rev_8_21_14_0_10_45_28]|uniref:Uncharacterized protein n=1 Tax=Candidatus Harrisonbacteria bacterium CG10_big_fil_rev_8_21_14_0_10_45_28 TaxID=1974586 RepID=A0A2H0UP03_9BACT|nr:MAG: hypothetical protein COU10_00885 [Candidatus Harrisonbacteria bacterium CG10_big_fil_rev_8_21_14_0_10_45_28]
MAGPSGIEGTRFARPYRPKGRGIEPLRRLRSDEMDNRVTHFASSPVVIKVIPFDPIFLAQKTLLLTRPL